MEDATALYRHYATDDVLLYVGVSLSPAKRTDQHAKQSGWFRQVARVSVEWFDTRREALEAERHAIITERPRFNVVHKNGRLEGEAAPALTPSETSRLFLETRLASFNPLYSVQKAADALGLSKNDVLREIEAGQLGYFEYGPPSGRWGRRKRFITGWQLIDWLEAKQAEGEREQKARRQGSGGPRVFSPEAREAVSAGLRRSWARRKASAA